jgi:hypothetical protein
MLPSSSSSSPSSSSIPTTPCDGDGLHHSPRNHPRSLVTLLSILAALVLFPALRQQLDYAPFYYRSMELLVDYPPIMFHQQQSTNKTFHLRRPRLARSFFFHTGASEEEINKFFYWDPTSIQNSSIALQPRWSCRDVSTRTSKLVFHHMPKSGGITIRALLKGYSLFCNASVAMVSHCTFLGRESMDGIIHWSNGHNTKHAKRNCMLATALNRSGHIVTKEQRLSTDFLNEHNFDVLAGHLPLGSDEFWKDPATAKHVSVQNLVFFRRPLEKFVSQIVADHPSLLGGTVDETAALIYQVVQNRTAHGDYFEMYSRTLIRPEQRSWVELERVNWTPEQRLHLSLQNMVESRMIVGILERLEPSIELIRFLLDKDEEVPKLAFSYFASEKLSKRISILHSNGNQTKNIVARIEQDPTMLHAFSEYLKYEQSAYDWAVQIHERQVKAMQDLYMELNMSTAGA